MSTFLTIIDICGTQRETSKLKLFKTNLEQFIYLFIYFTENNHIIFASSLYLHLNTFLQLKYDKSQWQLILQTLNIANNLEQAELKINVLSWPGTIFFK